MLKEVFILRAMKIHEGVYLYNIPTDVVIGKDKVQASCEDHGVFYTRVHDHLYHKSGCPTCAIMRQTSAATFIDNAMVRYGDSYDYTKVVYVNTYTPVEIVCNVHGSFLQQPIVHLKAVTGCPSCDRLNRSKTPEQFIDEANKVHDGIYSYEKVRYSNSKKRVQITCPIHGYFWQTPGNHVLRASGCPSCANIKRSKTLNANKQVNNLGKVDKGIIYLAQFTQDDEKFIKVGITTGDGVLFRFGQTHRGYRVSPLLEYEAPLATINIIEQEIIEYFSEHTYLPNIKFGGYTECFKVSATSTILKFINRRMM